MPRESPIKSETVRAAIIAVIMLLLFAGSLGAAYLYTLGHQPEAAGPEAFGRFEITPPPGWQVKTVREAGEFKRIMVDPEHEGRRIGLTEIHLAERLSPRGMLNLAASKRFSPYDSQVFENPMIHTLKNPAGIAAVFMESKIAIVDGDQRIPTHQFAGVLTVDGEHLWIIRLTDKLIDDAGKSVTQKPQSRFLENRQILERIAESARLSGTE